ncbi:MAG: site-2 protease family protein [Chloroflexi bacterium]|nr:site-2 protease family protein [Chloroflexota bacterium]
MGIDIALDASWFLIFFLLVYTLGFIQFPRDLHPGRFRVSADAISITLGIAASVLLFASVLAHELSHSWMAIQLGTSVKRITLFIFGGVAQIAGEPDRPLSEFLIAIMGPLMSVALAALFGAAWLWLRILDSADVANGMLTPLILLTGILAQVNGSLALFNLAPGFPLDGGRVLRAILWGATHSIATATKWASRVGQLIAVLLIGSAFIGFFTGFGIGGIWNAFIGLFLWNAANEGYRQTLMVESLRGVSVSQLMTRAEAVSPDLTVGEFVEQYLLRQRDQTFVVTDGFAFLGVIGTSNIRNVSRPEWNIRRVRDVMTPSTSLQVLNPSDSVTTALARLANSDAEELPVLDAGQVVGFIGQNELARYLRLNAERKQM